MWLSWLTRKSVMDSRSILLSGDYVPSDPTRLPDDPLSKAMQLGRFGTIMARPADWAEEPKFERVALAATKAVDERFALVPEGFASIGLSIHEQPNAPEADYETTPFLLSRCAVSNADFQCFVDAGSYEDLSLWPQEIWPHLIDLKDQTGHAAPRYWRSGRHDRRLANHPVVGICYYEAQAYATWAGFRLPTEAEWQMAASWRIRSAAHVIRRYPWGDSLDLTFCNIWASGHAGTLPVTGCERGAAPNGVLQLIGNVWEWTGSEFLCMDDRGRRIIGDMLMMSIRGGSFDTYFPWQATSSFRSGLGCLSRVHNVGFRCALDLPAS